MEDPKKVAAETESYRKIAFAGIAISTVATLTAILAVPMLYNYMQHVQSSLQTEVDFCQHRTDGLWDEYKNFQTLQGVNGRIRRAARRHTGEVTRSKKIRRQNEDEEVEIIYVDEEGNEVEDQTPTAAPTAAPAPVAQAQVPASSFAAAPPAHRSPASFASSPASLSSGSCCSCGVGPAGPPGQPGQDGAPGNDGNPGAPGHPGQD
ncbi:hypothetical protein CRE_26048, partial [Caenorhabditis remanei]